MTVDELRYALAKQIPSATGIETDYGTVPLAPIMRADVLRAVSETFEAYLALALAGEGEKVSSGRSDAHAPNCSLVKREVVASVEKEGAKPPLSRLEIFTDGSCLGNPGPGGWAALIRDATGERMLTGSARDTTNNRMELMAAIAALEAVEVGASIVLTTDSKYVQQGIKTWLRNWRTRGWRTSRGKPVKNQDLWCRLDSAASGRAISWRWTRGHVGHAENTRVDAAAYEAAQAAHFSESMKE